MSLDAGARLGPYEILGALGAGGMGAVYRARDTRLDRTVAIKVLLPELARDPERRQRFAREARTIASLTHPNICTLYEFDRYGDTDVLVMEHLAGETLAQRLTRGSLPLIEALRFAIQIADALAAAHKLGIVHRDLKPGNIMLTTSGAAHDGVPLVKLLDFGLAKLKAPSGPLTDASAETASRPLTSEGTILGTLQYMAPEQLQGNEADTRSDLFALGAIVYEMVAGRRAFEGESQAGLIAAILEHDPPPLAEREPLTPPALERITRKCLAKDPDARWNSAHDLAEALRWILEDTGGRPVVPVVPYRRSRAWTAAVAALVGIPIAAALWRVAGLSAPAPLMRTIPLTSYPGEERDPALSPDGQQVAFTWQGSGEHGPFNLYVKRVDGGEPLLVHEGTGEAFAPTWSPDGREVAFIRHLGVGDREPNDGVFLVPALGGSARLVARFRGPHSALGSMHGLSYSPDGRVLAVAHKPSVALPSGIHLLALDSGETRALTVAPTGFELGDYYPRFSPDGASIAFLRGRLIVETDVYVVPTAGGESRRLTTGNVNTLGLDWADAGRSLVFSSTRQARASAAGLWRVPLSGGEPTALEVGDPGQWPSLSRDGRRLVFTNSLWNWDLWRVGGPTAPAEARTPQPWARSTWIEWAPQYSPDGKTVAFTSRRSGNDEIWMADSDGQNVRQLTFLKQPQAFAFRGWSPDGERFAFVSMKDNLSQIYVVDARGGIPRPLLDASWESLSPSWSHDGQWIYFSSFRTGQRQLWRVRADGGEPVRLTRDGGTHSSESWDGRYVYFTKSGPDGGAEGLWRMPRDGGQEQLMLPDVGFTEWSVLPTGILFLQRAGGPGATVAFHDFVTGQVSPVAVLEEAPVELGFTVSPDGRWILYIRDESTSDIMLVENFQ